VQYIENLLEGSNMFLSFRSFTPRKHWQPRAEHVPSHGQSVSVCEAVNGGRCLCA